MIGPLETKDKVLFAISLGFGLIISITIIPIGIIYFLILYLYMKNFIENNSVFGFMKRIGKYAPVIGANIVIAGVILSAGLRADEAIWYGIGFVASMFFLYVLFLYQNILESKRETIVLFGFNGLINQNTMFTNAMAKIKNLIYDKEHQLIDENDLSQKSQTLFSSMNEYFSNTTSGKFKSEEIVNMLEQLEQMQKSGLLEIALYDRIKANIVRLKNSF